MIKLSEKIEGENFRGSTAVFDAITAAAGAKIPGRSGRRALLILSDFDDNASRYTLEQAIQAAERTQSSIFSLADETVAGAGYSKHSRRGMPKYADQLSQETGGEAFLIDSEHPLEKIFPQIKSDLQGFYKLLFYPTRSARNGKIRKLNLETSRKGVVLRYSRAYFAPKN